MSTQKKDKTKKIELTISDRLNIPNILPQQGGLVEQITAKGIRTKVEITPEVIKASELQDFTNPDGSPAVRWNPEKDKPVAVEFSDEEIRLILRAITTLDKQKEITPSNVDTVLKFKNA